MVPIRSFDDETIDEFNDGTVATLSAPGRLKRFQYRFFTAPRGRLGRRRFKCFADLDCDKAPAKLVVAGKWL